MPLHGLQRAVGNQGMQHLVRSSAVRPRAVVVQRKVGFEFEAQWNVRDVGTFTDADRAAQQRGKEDRDMLIAIRLLVQMTLQPGHPLLTDEERGRHEGLKTLWFAHPDLEAPKTAAALLWDAGRTDELLLTNAGTARLDAMLVDGDRFGQFAAPVEKSLMDGNVISEVPLAGHNLGKGQAGIVMNAKASKFQLTADASPSGGSNLEWVTEPLESADEVDAAMDGITAMASHLDGRQGDASIPVDEIDGIGGASKAKDGLVIYPFGGPLSFAPQVTGGMRLDQLGALVGYLANQKESMFERGSTFRGRMQANADLFGKGDLEYLSSAKDGAHRAIKATAGLPRGDKHALEGLLMVVAAYLTIGHGMRDGANAKSVAGGLMARTDFDHNFKLLPPALQQYFRDDPQRFVDLALDAASLRGTGGQRVIQGTVERGMAGDRTEREIPLTRAEWLVNIPQGVDLLKHYDNLGEGGKARVGADDARKDAWEGVHKSLGALGSVDDQVGPNAAKQKAFVAEFRRMSDRLPARDLKPVAVAVYELLERMNAGKSLGYGRKAPR